MHATHAKKTGQTPTRYAPDTAYLILFLYCLHIVLILFLYLQYRNNMRTICKQYKNNIRYAVSDTSWIGVGWVRNGGGEGRKGVVAAGLCKAL